MGFTACAALLMCTAAGPANPSPAGTVGVMADEASNPQFASVASVDEAAGLLTFMPRQPRRTAGFECSGIRIFVRDHKLREVPREKRVVEFHYGGFMMSQSHPGPSEARRLAVALRYGPSSIEAQILGREGRIYELGPEPDPDDIDGRNPAVVTWHDDGIQYFVASDTLASSELIDIAMSIHR
jgi:hypothetical protein